MGHGLQPETHVDSEWCRFRFRANEEDYRPVEFPPPGPYWCSGYGSDYAIVIAYIPGNRTYLEIIDELHHYWPEARDTMTGNTFDIDFQGKDELTFSERFPKPEWWVE